MKSVNFWTFLIFTILIGLFQSCEKDPIPEPSNLEDEQIESSSFLDYDWNPIEQQFFSLRNTGSIEVVDFRNTNTKQIFRPELLKVYAEIARQNEVYNFAEDIFMKAGSPLWSQAKVTEYTGSARALVMIPVQYQSQQKVSAVISVAIEDYNTVTESYVIDAISRDEILLNDVGYPQQKESFASWLIRFEKDYYGNENNTILEAKYCELKNVGGNLPPNPCEWILFTICTDDETQTTWRAGVDILPPHLDHDGDGILNNEDQDWQELLRRLGTNNQDLVNRIQEYWNDTYASRYGDYGSFWNDWDYDDGGRFGDFDGGVPIEDLWSDIRGFFDWIVDIFGGDDYDMGHNQDEGAWDVDCPFDPLLPGENVSFRNTSCQDVYVKYCNGIEQNPNWWEFTDWIVCVTCSDQDLENTERRLQMLLQDYIGSYDLSDWQSLIAELAQGGPVNASRKDFFDYLNQRLLYYFAEAHQDYDEFSLPVPLQEWLVEHPGLIGALLMESSVTGQGQTSPGDLTSLMNQIFDVGSQLDLSDADLVFLVEHPEILTEMHSFLAENPDDEMAEAYAIFLLEDDHLGDVDLETINPFHEYANNIAILERERSAQPQEIENGIEILDSYLYATPGVPTGVPIGGSNVNPLGGPDLDFGADGDVTILNEENQDVARSPISKQEKRMKRLFWIATTLTGNGKSITDAYLEEFHENSGVFDYYNETLSEMVMNSTQMKNWLKNYGDELNTQLAITGGDINSVEAPEVDRTALNETYTLTILINDTQIINMDRLDSYNFNETTGEWDCYFVVNVVDHFGLDDDDAIDFQDHGGGVSGNGFIAWWALQHLHAWAPFRTDIWFVVQLGGRI